MQIWHGCSCDTFLTVPIGSTTNSSPGIGLVLEQNPLRRINCIAVGGDQIMDALTSAAAAGMRSRIESLDMLANNIANSSAPGFKADREFYSVYISAEAMESAEGTTTMPVIERQWTDFQQGALTPTHNALDLGLNGNGFFIADSSSGKIFTRNGSFRLSAQGQLQTSDGHAVLDANEKPIVLDSTKSIDVSPQG